MRIMIVLFCTLLCMRRAGVTAFSAGPSLGGIKSWSTAAAPGDGEAARGEGGSASR